MSQNQFEIIPINDDPYADATLLGHSEIVNTLKKFILSDTMISASSIAIHGDWGSGKTSIMRTIEKQLEEEDVEVIFFDAWAYENSNPPLGLISEIARKTNPTKAKKIIEIAAFILVQNFTGINIKNLIDDMRDDTKKPLNFHKEINDVVKRVGKKFIILIDDLDRCSIENTLQILALMKLFLSVEKCLCIAGVDFRRLQQAWKMKYKIEEKTKDDKTTVKDESKDYLDKIFQIRVAIPVPNEDRVKEYYGHITKNMPAPLLSLFAEIGPSNPRAIKRLLNLISYRTFLLNNDASKLISSCLWCLLEYRYENENLIKMSKALELQSSSLVDVIFNDRKDKVRSTMNGTGSEITKIIAKKEIWNFFIYANTVVNDQSISPADLKNDFEILSTLTTELER